MKKIVASLLIVMSTASAFAAMNYSSISAADAAIMYGPDYVEPCASTTPNPVPSSGLTCQEGMICPVGYEPERKACWDSVDCGVICKNMHLWDY